MNTSPSQVKSLYQRLKEAGIETDGYQSDLHFPITEESTRILREWREESELPKPMGTRFTCRRTGEPWYEVPFAYDPFWDKKMKAKRDKQNAEIMDTIDPSWGD